MKAILLRDFSDFDLTTEEFSDQKVVFLGQKRILPGQKRGAHTAHSTFFLSHPWRAPDRPVIVGLCCLGKEFSDTFTFKCPPPESTRN